MRKHFLLGTLLLCLAILLYADQQPAKAQTGPTAVYRTFLPLIANNYSTAISDVNKYRALANLNPVTANRDWNEAGQVHSLYMVKNNQVTHAEEMNNAWYTIEGAAAGQASILLGSNDLNLALHGDSVVSKWMTGPFHALGILEPRLNETGYGQYSEATGLSTQMAATLDIFRGIDYFGTWIYPVIFPANGKVLPLGQYSGGEYPDPLSPCAGYAAPTGQPIILQYGSGTPVTLTASYLFQSGVGVEKCAYTSVSYTNPDILQQNIGRSVLAAHSAVIIIPRYPLAAGSYTAMVIANGTTQNWVFTVPNSPMGAINAQISPTATVGIKNTTVEYSSATWPALSYSEQGGRKTWTLSGIAGETKTWPPDWRRGPVLDMVRIYYRNKDGELRKTWAVVGVNLPAYFVVHDQKSYQDYSQSGLGDQDYYVSFLSGANTHDNVMANFDKPGQHVTLTASGESVSENGIDWSKCRPKHNPACFLPLYYENLFTLAGSPGASNDLILNGEAPSDPAYGFLVWSVEIK